MVNNSSSAIYECEVMHHRLTPTVHHFRYRVFYLWLDLDELAGLSRRLRLLGINRFSLFSYCDADHLGTDPGSAKDRLFSWLAGEGVDTSAIQTVRLLSFPRVLGYIFNPVCFFYCFDRDGAPLCAVAQVTNTFHEKKLYLVQDREPDGRFRRIVPKLFYVSPYSDLDLLFDFKLRVPADKLDIHIDDRKGDERILLSAVSGNRVPLSDARLLWCSVKYPLLTLKVIFLIHWEALRLWIKRLPVHRKASRPDLQQEVLRPHATLAVNTTSKP
jgi:DUF1365 family protein